MRTGGCGHYLVVRDRGDRRRCVHSLHARAIGRKPSRTAGRGQWRELIAAYDAHGGREVEGVLSV